MKKQFTVKDYIDMFSGRKNGVVGVNREGMLAWSQRSDIEFAGAVASLHDLYIARHHMGEKGVFAVYDDETGVVT